MNDQIKLVPCESGYRVVVGERWTGHLMRRLWESDGQRELDHWLVGPASIDAKCLPFPTLGQGLDYLLSTINAEARHA